MPEEAIGGLLGWTVRVVGYVLVDVVLEILVKGLGYALLRGLGVRTHPESAWCAVVGLAFWFLCMAAAVAIWRHTHPA
ncbi:MULTISPECIES: hypothetical protein [Pseudoxanthomonas]|jgi:hypothetical protein|uniref:Uncharacterized protein n=1 Tax=Pseudoxanthomonas taiwanensis J19 TaxID=935569 RepID=A0A562DH65_9GAMM|nr:MULTISPECIES: hypothetical protein [Pseudoxanthomonas]RRN78929.1 hypothetical protein EIM50_12000 [Pseudoxanthomonas sp. SGD-10]TWH08961.1 hypothetical protein L613_004300000220 [Pseudoxanthomonas taiwanensis J19]